MSQDSSAAAGRATSLIVSVIVPCRNERAWIEPFLASVFRQEMDAGWALEVLIADGMSDDSTLEILERCRSRYGGLRVIPNPGRIVSTGLNLAIRAATGDVIVRMDIHTSYANDYIRECIRVLRETGADNVGGPWVAEGAGSFARASAAAFRNAFCTGGARGHDPSHDGPVDTVYLGCWPRDVFERIGLFDEELHRNQDDELNLRIVRSGGTIWQSTRIRSAYHPRSCWRKLFFQYFQYGYWKVRVIRRHGRPASWRHLVPGAAVAAGAVLASLCAAAGITGYTAAAASIGSVLACLAGAYLLLAIAAALVQIGREPISVVMLLPAVFATYHTAYGVGFLLGVLERNAGPARSRLVTALTR